VVRVRMCQQDARHGREPKRADPRDKGTGLEAAAGVDEHSVVGAREEVDIAVVVVGDPEAKPAACDEVHVIVEGDGAHRLRRLARPGLARLARFEHYTAEWYKSSIPRKHSAVERTNPVPVDPLLRPLLDVTASMGTAPPVSVEEARTAVDERSRILIATHYADPPEPASVIERTIPVNGADIPVRIYRPNRNGSLPAHVYIHGGGFWLGSLDSCDNPCREISVGAGALVLSVGYRLAPEHPFPTGPEDCYAALCWLFEHAEELGVDSASISVGGESAGGNLAAVVALMARDRQGPPLVLQVLGIPVADLTMSQPSVAALGTGYLLTRAGMAEYRSHYLSRDEDMFHPYASPLLAPDLGSLPPALVMTMEYDPLRDEGEALARRLVESGTPTRHIRWLGHIHGSALFTRIIPSARDYHRTVIESLRAAYATATVRSYA
jgi:acetyl esterase